MRELFLLITAAGAMAMAYVAGAIQPVFANDQTGIVWAIAGLGVLGTLLARRKRMALVWLCEHHVAPLLGLLGTVIGVMLAMQSFNGVPGPEQLGGVFVALNTTAAGLTVQLYLMLVREITR